MAEKERIKQLQKRAEKIVKENFNTGKQEMNADEVARLLEELSVHQIELEMQNDELQRSQQALEYEKNKYLDVYENAPVPYITITATGNIVHQNRKALSIFSNGRGQMDYISIFPFIDSGSKTPFRKLMGHVFTGGGSSSSTIVLIAADGSKIESKLHFSVYYDNDLQQDLCRLTITDIAEEKQAYDKQLKESEEKYRSVVTAMNEGVIMRNRHGEILTWNKAAERILGISGEEIRRADSRKPGGRSVREDGTDFPDDEHPAFITLRTGKAQHQVIMGIEKAPGNVRWISVNSEPIFIDGSDLPEAVVTSFSDITQQKNTERELRQLNATKDKLFSIIAHDLKSPFNAQLGLLELMMDEQADYTTEQRHRFMNMIYDSAKQSFALLDNLLLWSRSQTGKIPYSPVDVNISEAIDSSIEMYKATLEIKRIKLRRVYNCPNDLVVSADQDMLDTVLRNLISNAIKFSYEDGEIVIYVSEIENGHITVAVQDHGIGIASENIGRLFHPDHNLSTNGTKNEKGTGLGLIICREFVERNGGKIWVESEEGKGSTFHFTLKNVNNTRRCERECLQETNRLLAQFKANPDLLDHTHHALVPKFRVAYKLFSDETISAFAGDLQKLAHQYDVAQFKNLSNILIESLKEDDVNQINICFSEFDKLVEEIEQLRLME